MSHTLRVLTFLSLLLLSLRHGSSSRIIVVPVDGSHWINMEVILKQLHSRGHNITVLRSPNSWFIPSNSSFFTSINGRMLEDEVDLNYYNRMLGDVIECRKYPRFIQTFCQQRLISSMLIKGHDILARGVASMLEDPDFMKGMQEAKFDLMITDPCLPTGLLLGGYLKLPMVFNVRWINTGESHFTIAPSPLSYVPVPGSELHDKMDFLERTRNMLLYIYNVYEQYYIINSAYSDILQRHFPPGTNLLSLQRSAEIWLQRTDFVFEFPRPTMPNLVYIGGFQCKEAKPLPAELESFMQSSGEHGVVVMSLGTLVSALPRKTTEAIAAAFAELPQKVVWRFVGEKPSSLGNNTLLVKWLPQSDLLGHPKTRLFVAHGGTNGIYESIYHAVPVLGIPLLFDQFDNVVRLQVRGAGLMIEANSLTKDNFLEALKNILLTPSYSQNIKRLSTLHRDQPVAPMDKALFWIEYVIRHKNTKHLQATGFSLPWYSYFCLDVAAFLMALVGTVIWLLVFTCQVLCCRRFRKKIKSE